MMQNPFETIQSELKELKGLVTQLLTKPEKDLSNNVYTIKEAAELLHVDSQTIRNHIERGNIKASFIGRRILINHEELFDSLNEVKSLKYKRQA
ncbi:helix-turn-helix domain-containing protein [Flavobacterium sp. FlaQc-28]|uniref:helix-turn-helix domain-containing protein n=1 Tax=Flavobacterium sp. FlaQc-28 TaxID=3374178 RepID=UPI003756D56D